MAGELERFLQQAAERLAERVKQGQKPPRPVAKQLPVRQAERTRFAPDIVDAEIVETTNSEDLNRRELGPNPLSNLDTLPPLAQTISLADEKMASRVHEDLDHNLVQLRQASSALGPARSPGTSVSSIVQRRTVAVSPLVEMLRDPKTIRAAFVASEIFHRKF